MFNSQPSIQMLTSSPSLDSHSPSSPSLSSLERPPVWLRPPSPPPPPTPTTLTTRCVRGVREKVSIIRGCDFQVWSYGYEGPSGPIPEASSVVFTPTPDSLTSTVHSTRTRIVCLHVHTSTRVLHTHPHTGLRDGARFGRGRRLRPRSGVRRRRQPARES